MSLLLNIAQFVIVLGLLLFFHEFGHYIMARLFKVEVEEFGFGFPPRIVRLFKIGPTDFTLNWIPFGAFVRPKGENDPEVAGGLAAASPWVRLGVLFGGPVANLLVGIILFSVLFMNVGKPNTAVVQVADTMPGSPALQAGLQSGDVILQANGQAVTSISAMQAVISQNAGKPVSVTYSRNGVSTTVQMTPRAEPPEGQGPLGVTLTNPYVPIGFGEAVPAAVSAAADQAKQLFLMPVNLIRGTLQPEQARLVGFKGIYDIYTEAGRMDAEATATPGSTTPALFRLSFVAAISIALGLTNLLPIPALDGGRILFVLPEIILRRRIPARYENMINLIGFAALLLLMAYITIQDFVNPVIIK